MVNCRAPRGARGLKQQYHSGGGALKRSRPARGAWIETRQFARGRQHLWSRPARGAWIETPCNFPELLRFRSRPARGAWIETYTYLGFLFSRKSRAPRGARGLKPP